MSWVTQPGPVRRDPASSGVVVVRHGGQVGLCGGDLLIASMPYPANLSRPVADLATYLCCVRSGPPCTEFVGVGLGVSWDDHGIG